MPEVNRIVSATAPPTIANLAVGFDLLGLAVEGIGDVVSAQFTEVPGVQLLEITGNGSKLSKEVEKNTATAGVVQMLSDLKERVPNFNKGIGITLKKRMPLGSGMGSSASSAAAGVLAVNELLGTPFTKDELIPYALIGEAVASGAIHGDNVVPSLLGGLVLMRSNEPADVLRIPFIDGLFILLIHPHVEVMTEESRGKLEQELSLKSHIGQSADLAAFIHAMHTRDIKVLRRCMNDCIIGPQRESDIPHFDEVMDIVASQQGINYNISGSGPSSFAFFEALQHAKHAADLVQRLFEKLGIDCDVDVTRVDNKGARIIENNEVL